MPITNAIAPQSIAATDKVAAEAGFSSSAITVWKSDATINETNDMNWGARIFSVVVFFFFTEEIFHTELCDETIGGDNTIS